MAPANEEGSCGKGAANLLPLSSAIGVGHLKDCRGQEGVRGEHGVELGHTMPHLEENRQESVASRDKYDSLTTRQLATLPCPGIRLTLTETLRPLSGDLQVLGAGLGAD
ncbi:uncharacterized protein VDAG_10411 [Verticillium dahliae VdLs.17]|uniref:Uncharacterized protein n=1 Tax=Verticillium dahliae (strain VdLs.17 / ATCC MYA-4575 / FGSC 10137) TaxID=498257 RepID=G2XJS9_VERDV|nr:uncharacterized protein VDAG_10411 [Verticillium dahliae VdLs.17]EGY20782.1 hypothetical protein VDAG_10411 [Verticillium dahliae VdLs.17]KAH6708061.1 hypothetical protein EV126DRAFT_103757 [Verticillium dahliae]